MINGTWLAFAGIVALFIISVLLYWSDKKNGERKLRQAGLFLAGLAIGAGALLAVIQQTHPKDPSMSMEMGMESEEETSDVETLAKMAHEALRQQDFNRVSDLSRKITAIQPNHPETLAHIGMLHFSMGESDGAIDFFNRALKEDLKQEEALLYKGMVLFQTGKKSEGKKVWEEYQKLAPPDAPGRTMIQVFLSKGS